MGKLRSLIISKWLCWSFGLISGCLLFLSNQENCSQNIKRELARAGNTSKQVDNSLQNKSLKLHRYYKLSYKERYSSEQQPATRFVSSESGSSSIYEWLNCDDIRKILKDLSQDQAQQSSKENADEGNKFIYFSTIRNQTGHHMRVVIKHALWQNISSESESYRYHSAKREINNLRRLKLLKWKGIPDLIGSCVLPQSITYVVTEIIGKPLCSGTGINLRCAMAIEIKSALENSSDRDFAALQWLSKVLCFFKQFEENNVFMEDFSGINFYFSPDTLDLFIVDADSLIFYGDVRISSRSSCRDQSECIRPKGNLWRTSALNYKIYYSCKEMIGYCANNTCRGYDVSLHTCGIGRWFVLPLFHIIPTPFFQDYIHIRNCTMEPLPENRCSLSHCCEVSLKMVEKFFKMKKASNFLRVLT